MWSIQHLNLPNPEDSKLTIMGSKLLWMIITILLPDFPLAHAIVERHTAVKSIQQTQKAWKVSEHMTGFGGKDRRCQEVPER
jgi:hypothetical protein